MQERHVLESGSDMMDSCFSYGAIWRPPVRDLGGPQFENMALLYVADDYSKCPLPISLPSLPHPYVAHGLSPKTASSAYPIWQYPPFRIVFSPLYSEPGPCEFFQWSLAISPSRPPGAYSSLPLRSPALYRYCQFSIGWIGYTPLKYNHNRRWDYS